MKKIENLSQVTYQESGEQFCIDRITENGICNVILRNKNNSPYGIYARVEYLDVGETMSSPYLNWDNLFFCSNYYGASVNCEYMNIAVQQGKKTTATAYVDPKSYIKLCEALPKNCFAVPYPENASNKSMAFVYRDGTLNELFGFERIKHLYSLHRIIDIDWVKLHTWFNLPLSSFSNPEISGINLQNAGSAIAEQIAVGLLLGYPIESTVAYIKHSYEVIHLQGKWEARKHFKCSNESFIDSFKQVWHKKGNVIYTDKQNEMQWYE